MNEYIISLLNNMKDSDRVNLLDSFQQIAYLSSHNFNQDSIFLDPQFLIKLLHYLFTFQIETIFIICNNIIADSNFNIDLFNIFMDHNYILFLIDNYQNNEHFLTMLNIIISKAFSFDLNYLSTFFNAIIIIPFLINKLHSKIIDERLLSLDSLQYLSYNKHCLCDALKNNLLQAIEYSLPMSNLQEFSLKLFLINSIHEFDKSIKFQDLVIVSLLFNHLKQSEGSQTKIMIKYLNYLITENTQLFFESDIINDLLSIVLSCSFSKRKEIVFFFASAFSIILKYCSQSTHQILFENLEMKFKNLMIHDIISLIMETCMSFDDDKCLFCLNIIKKYFENNPDDAFSAAEEASFHNILLDIISDGDNGYEYSSAFAQLLFNTYFNMNIENEDFDI